MYYDGEGIPAMFAFAVIGLFSSALTILGMICWLCNHVKFI